MIPVGRLRDSLLKKISDMPMSPVVSNTVFKDFCPEEYARYEPEVKDQFFYVKANRRAIDISEMKLDEDRPWPIRDESKDLAILYTDLSLEIPLTHEAWSDEQTINHIRTHGTLKKAAGFPESYMPRYFGVSHIKNREAFVETDWWNKYKENYTEIVKLGMVYQSCAKKEWGEIADLHEEKARTYLISGFHVLYWQLRLFGQGNENIKKFMWSQYGFNPFQGGADNMARKIFLKKSGRYTRPIRFTWDVKGYDRKVDLFHVAKRRLRFFKNANKKFHDFAKWVTDGLITSLLVLLNGDVCFRRRGNNSGSGMTTANNIEAGFEILADILIAAYYVKFKEFPTREQVFDQLIMLYGDDNMGCVEEDFDQILNYTWLADRLLRFHGLVLKTFTGGYEHPLGDLPFLGFTLKQVGNYYFPLWNRKRLLLPIIYRYETCSNAEFCQQFYSVLLMSYPHTELWMDLRRIYIKLLNEISKKDGSPQFKTMYALGAPTDIQMFTWYQGLEAWMEDGPQKEFFVMSENLLNILNDKTLYREAVLQVQQQIDKDGPIRFQPCVAPSGVDLNVHDYGGQIFLDNDSVDTFSKITSYSLCFNYYNVLKEHFKQCAFKPFEIESYLGTCQNLHYGTLKANTPFTGNFVINLLSAPALNVLHNKLAYCAFRYIELSIYQSLAYEQNLEILKQTLYWMKHVENQCGTHMIPSVFELTGTLVKTDVIALARIAIMRKVGGFNPYGNGQSVENYVKYSKRSDLHVHHGYIKFLDSELIDPQTDLDVDVTLAIFGHFVWPSFKWKDKCLQQQRQVKSDEMDLSQLPPDFMFWELCGGSMAYGNKNKGRRAKFIANLPNTMTPIQKQSAWLDHKALSKPSKPQQKPKQKTVKQPLAINTTNKTVRGKFQNGLYGSSLPLKMEHGNTIQAAGKTMVLSDCAARWALWLTDPFIYFRRTTNKGWEKKYAAIVSDLVSVLPCIPSFPALPSYKFICVARGSFNTNSGGSGFVAISFFRPANNYLLVNNDTAPIMTSGSTWAGTTSFPAMDTGAAIATGVVPLNWSAPFTTASLVGPAFFRNTFGGLQISYSGTLLNVAGDIFHVHMSNHDSLSGIAPDTMAPQPGYYTEPVVRGKWSKQIWCHAMEKEYYYACDPFFGVAPAGSWYAPDPFQKTHNMGIMVMGLPSAPFRFEVVAGFEAIGYGIQQSKTANMADTVGRDIISSHVTPDSARVLNNSPSLIQRMFESPTVSYAADRLGRAVVDYGVTKFGSWVGTGVGNAQRALMMGDNNPGYTVTDAPDDDGLHDESDTTYASGDLKPDRDSNGKPTEQKLKDLPDNVKHVQQKTVHTNYFKNVDHYSPNYKSGESYQEHNVDGRVTGHYWHQDGTITNRPDNYQISHEGAHVYQDEQFGSRGPNTEGDLIPGSKDELKRGVTYRRTTTT